MSENTNNENTNNNQEQKKNFSEVVRNLTDSDKAKIYNTYAKMNGYLETPPTIQQFLEDDFYIGKSFDNGKAVYPFWREKLAEIYPTPFFETNKYKILILSGATGIGKCLGREQEMDFYMSDEDIKKFGLENYVIEEKEL